MALKHILGKEYGITASRGKWIEKKGIKYMPTWHPAALLRDEGKKIDVVEYSKDLVQFIKNALSPAKDVEVYILDDKKSEALAVAEGDNLSLAIGKKGQNVKLAARLTKCKIDVKTREQVQEEGINIYKYYEA